MLQSTEVNRERLRRLREERANREFRLRFPDINIVDPLKEAGLGFLGFLGEGLGDVVSGLPEPVRETGGDILRGLDRATRLAGLGIGTGVAMSPIGMFGNFVPGLRDWLPNMVDIPDAARAFNELRKQGDWDAAISAYQDELDAGKYFWGLTEAAGSLIPTGGPALIGGKLISTAPKLAQTLAKVAPAAM